MNVLDFVNAFDFENIFVCVNVLEKVFDSVGVLENVFDSVNVSVGIGRHSSIVVPLDTFKSPNVSF